MPENQHNPARQMSANALAFVGDAVYDLYIRTRMATMHQASTAHALHQRATGYVKAAAQAKIAKQLFGELTEEEQDVFKRGRNAKSHTIPKNADLQEYRHATGFEAVMGYLHMCGNSERLGVLLQKAVEIIEYREPMEQDNTMT